MKHEARMYIAIYMYDELHIYIMKNVRVLMENVSTEKRACL